MPGVSRLRLAGIALAQDESIEVRRSAGKLSHLVDSINEDPLEGKYGIGHTRWATHGRATAGNAHPHRDCSGRTVLVHNGIIENYLELKRELAGEGHHFATETDSEVMAHLVERESNGDGLEHAVRRALRTVQGIYGMVLMSANDPERSWPCARGRRSSSAWAMASSSSRPTSPRFFPTPAT
jgi:glucosamine--fructose-6-phosphate aminotransferase (isomerizing)